MRRNWGLLLLAPLVLACGGCLKSKVTVHVNPDGSGHLVVSRFFGRQAVEMWEAQRAQMAGMAGEGMSDEMLKRFARDPFYDEKALKRDARGFGPSAKFVKARRVDAEGGRGSVAVYTFKDINDICLAMDQRAVMSMMSMGMGDMMDRDGDEEDGDEPAEFRRSRRGKTGIEFSLQTGAVNRLKILLPETAQADADEDKDAEPPSGAEDEESDEMAGMAGMDGGDYAMMMAQRMPAGFNYRHSMGYAEDMMSRGLGVSVEIEVNGVVAASDAAFTNATRKNRFILMDVDTSRKAKDAGAKSDWARRMERFGYGDPERMLKNLHRIPGAIVEPKREVTIAFQ
jgi:hypothetical protein